MFEDVYDVKTPELERQEAAMKAHVAKYADKYDLSVYESDETYVDPSARS
jgi:hypothetical protein